MTLAGWFTLAAPKESQVLHLGHVDVDNGAGLNEELPHQALVDLLIQASDVDGGI